MHCPACHHEISAADRFCPQCGTAIDPPGPARAAPTVPPEPDPEGTPVPEPPFEAAPTLTQPAAENPGPPGPAGASSRRSDSVATERYVPGTILSGRYRVIGRLGEGGMGEVYQADDLKLGQKVALKFLPAGLEADPERLEMLLDEVRVARRVSHPSVCRVYDVGEADGHHFLSMEYIDGEDLASLLRRIGRLPTAKAVEIARQICAGLAAAHAQGVLHRDLKPANVMIDGRGRARITDFGLAREAEAVAGRDARDGTPAYMAPEQLAGREATVRSDLYALGLVLYELFSGRRAFEARSFAEAIDERSSGPPSSPASHVGDLDPAVERAILRCLEPQASERPASALAVAAALPGGDTLAASLAAGETPSPEMVAAAPTEGTMRPGLAVGAVVFCLVAILLTSALEFQQVVAPGGRPPIVLADRARQVLEELGYPGGAGDEAWDYATDQGVSEYLLEHPGALDSVVAGDTPPLYRFWYRASPGTLLPRLADRVSPTDPPRTTPGSALVTLDTEGRLVGLEVVPGDSSGEPPATVASWQGGVPGETLWELAGLDAGALRPAEPERLPPVFADRREAWVGEYPAGLALRAEAATTAGRLGWLQIYSPDLGDAGVEAADLPATFVWLLYLLFALILVAGLWLARSNLVSGRGDRHGALRVGSWIGAAYLVTWVIGASHGLALAEGVRFFRVVAMSLLFGVLTGIFYIGLEPALRRRWPRRIVSWARFLDGRLRDPLVGRDLLLGAVATAVMFLLPVLWWELAPLLGAQRPLLLVEAPEPAAWGVRGVLRVWPRMLSIGPLLALGFMVLLLAMTRLARYEWIAAALFVGIQTFGLAVRDSVTAPFGILGIALPIVVLVAVMLRFGLLATVTLVTLLHLAIFYPVTKLGPWWSGGRMTLFATVVVVAAYGAWACARRGPPRPAAGSA